MSERFDELVGDISDPDERERLRRVHELLLRVEAPPAPAHAAAIPLARRRRPRRLALLAAALAAAAFGAGYLVGDSGEPETERVISMSGAGAASSATGSIELLTEDAAGNWPMHLVVRGLEPSRDRDDWYELWLTKNGRLAASCGRFIVRAGRNEVTLTVPYGLRRYDGWVVTRRGSSQPLLTT